MAISGWATGDPATGAADVTHYMKLDEQNENAMCQDCPPGLICLTGGATVYPYAELGTGTSYAAWCVGKDPTITWYNPALQI